MAKVTRRAVERAVPEEMEIVDHGEFLEVLDGAGDHLALLGLDPLAVQVDLSVVLVDADDVQTWGQDADDRLRAEQVATWENAGFEAAEGGELREGEALDDPETTVWSYDLPVFAYPDDVSGLAAVLTWAAAQPRDFALWGPDLPMTTLEAS